MILLLGALTVFAPAQHRHVSARAADAPALFQSHRGRRSNSRWPLFSWDSRWARAVWPFADRFGRKPPLYAGMLFFTLASGGCAFAAWSINALTAFRLLQALGACAGVVISRAMVRDLFPPQETSQVYSALILVMGVSPMVAPLLGAYVLVDLGWKSIFLSVMLAARWPSWDSSSVLPESLRPRAPFRWATSFATYRGLLADRFFLGSRRSPPDSAPRACSPTSRARPSSSSIFLD